MTHEPPTLPSNILHSALEYECAKRVLPAMKLDADRSGTYIEGNTDKGYTDQFREYVNQCAKISEYEYRNEKLPKEYMIAFQSLLKLDSREWYK